MKSYWGGLTSSKALSRRRLLGASAAGLGGAALLAACGGKDKSSSSAGSSAGSSGVALNNPKEGTFSPSSGTPQTGGRFRWTVNFTADNFNAITQYNEGASLGGVYVYDRPLTSREDTRRYVLEAMQSIELKDPLTVVMKLQPGMKYQNVAPVNGREVEAEDIIQTQKYAKDEPKTFDRTFIDSFLDKIEATDKQTVVLHLKRPNAYLFGGQMLGSGTGQPIIPKETLGAKLDTALQVGSGPYMADSSNRAQQHYVYKQNPGFRLRSQGLPYVNETEFTYLIDKTAAETAFYGGQLEYWLNPTPQQMITAKQRLPNAQFFELPGFSSTNFSFNNWPDKNLPFRDVRVREAIWRLTSREDILKRGYQGAGVVPAGLIPASLKPYQVDPKDVEQYVSNDVQKAKQLLSAANWDENKTWRIQIRASGDVLESVGVVEQANLARGGIKTVLDPVGSAFFERLGSKDWDMMFETPPGNDTPGQQLRTQHSDSWSPVYTGFALFDKDIDAQIEKAEETLDYDQNRKMVIDIQKLCMSKFTASWEVLTQFQLFTLAPKVQNYELTLVPTVMQHRMWLKS